MSRFIFYLVFLTTPSFVFAFTTQQNSTTLGFYRDYQQNAHYPFYFSWSLHGYYDHNVETTVNLYLNNDFAANGWNLFGAQIEIDVPIAENQTMGPERQSRLKLGRQIFSEGFDFLLLDGVQMPIYWSATGGVMPIAGYLHSPDPDQPQGNSAPVVGAVVWQSFWSAMWRAGATARDDNLANRFIFASVLRGFDSLPWAPQIMAREEWQVADFSLNQLAGEIMVSPANTLSARVGYSDLAPRPINKSSATSFIYYLFAISPTRTVSADLQWQKTERVRYSLGAAHSTFSSAFDNDTGDRQDLGSDILLRTGRWLSLSFTHLKSYGGEIFDCGGRYTHDLSERARLDFQYDLAYLEKIDRIQSFVHHARTSYERQVASNTSALISVEGERNMYFQFDLRAMVYVTNLN